MGNGLITIKDLARILGVSPSTVSRALKDHPDISTKTKKQVADLAKKMRYEPNTIAVSLRGQKTKTIGVIIPEFVHYFFSTVISGIEEVAQRAGYNVLLCSSNGSFDREVSVAKVLLSRRVDGLLICITKNSKNVRHLLEFKERGVPLVFFDCASESMQADKVIIDDFKAAQTAVGHLVEQGCKSIVYLGGPASLLINQKRYEGYKNALESEDLCFDKALVYDVEEGSIEEGRQAARSFLTLSPRPDGLFATADLLAIGAMREIKKAGLRIPQDMAIVGFSNWEIAELCEPTLTSVFQPGKEMGARATELLLDRIDNLEGDPQIQVLETELIIRASSVKQ